MNPATPTAAANPAAPGAQASRPRRGIPKAMVERLILGTVVLGSFAAIFWSINRLRSLQAQSQALNQRVSRITAEIDLMRTRWTDGKAREIEELHATIPESLFRGEAEVSKWLEELQEAAVPLALDTAVRVGEITSFTNSVGNISRIRATIDLRQDRANPAARPLYHRMLQWARMVTSQPRRVDLLNLSVTGVTANSGEATAILELWTREPSPGDATPAEPKEGTASPPSPVEAGPGAGPSSPAPEPTAIDVAANRLPEDQP